MFLIGSIVDAEDLIEPVQEEKEAGMQQKVGIDYGGGMANIDPKTGIRFGVISMHSVIEAWMEESQADFGKPEEVECPHCFNVQYGDMEWDEEIICKKCGEEFLCTLPDFAEPLGYFLENEQYTMVDCLDSDIMILRSPYYTHAMYCSPCVPGAGNLNSPIPDGGIKAYCLGHDWFDERKAPYPVFRVEDGQEVFPE